jgi:predicted nucleic acid-binding protein
MRGEAMERVVLDTNVFVAAGFNRDSHAARIVEGLGRGAWQMVWNRATRDETRAVLTRIPPLSWERVAPLFRPEDEFRGATDPGAYERVRDPADREFAALAAAAGAIVVTNDEHLLGEREALDVRVLTPREFIDAVSPTARCGGRPADPAGHHHHRHRRRPRRGARRPPQRG